MALYPLILELSAMFKVRKRIFARVKEGFLEETYPQYCPSAWSSIIVSTERCQALLPASPPRIPQIGFLSIQQQKTPSKNGKDLLKACFICSCKNALAMVKREE